MELAEIIRELSKLTEEKRERAILQHASAGHVPAWCTPAEFVPVCFSLRSRDGVPHGFEYRVSRDYFALGGTDFIRMPMWPGTAQTILNGLGCMLPTSKMVDQIHSVGKPIVMPTATSAKVEVATYVTTSARCDRAVKTAGLRPDALVSGCRKDIVIGAGLAKHPGNVGIYGGLKPLADDGGGWYQTKPNFSDHYNRYVDYSHGVRAVLRAAKLDGLSVDLFDVLDDANLAVCLSADGVLTLKQYPLFS